MTIGTTFASKHGRGPEKAVIVGERGDRYVMEFVANNGTLPKDMRFELLKGGLEANEYGWREIKE